MTHAYTARRIRLTWVLAVFALVGCAAAPVDWQSRPGVSQVQGPAFDVFFEPVKGDRTFFSAFRLTVVNKAEETLAVDWNRTRYLYDGKNAGAFAFKGIFPEQIKSGSVESDIVEPGAQLTKTIAPVRLVAFAPMGAKGVGVAEKGLRAGKLPDGDNGIFLVLSSSSRTFRTELFVHIETVPGPSPP